MRKIQAFFLAAIAICGPVLAEPPTGSRLGDRSSGGFKYTDEQADEAAARIASCMVAKRGPAAKTYISATTPKELAEIQRALFKEIQCLSHSNLTIMSDTTVFHIPTDTLRGKIAEAILKDERGSIDALSVLALAKEYSRPWFAATGRDAVVDEMGVCVADTNPRGIAALLATRGFSKEENVAFGAIVPSLGTCLRVGAKLQANRPALRAALADALYQRVHRPAPAIQAAAAEAAARQARLDFKRFTECVVKKQSQDARTYILDDLDEQQTTRFRNKMLDQSCWLASTGLSDPIATTGLNLQGSLAEALLASEPASTPLHEVKAIAPLKHEPVTEEERQKNGPEMLKFIERMAFLFEWGECVVRANVAGAHALLKSDPTSADESKALGTLKPAFEGCVSQGQNLSASTDDMRAAVAVNYYRLAHSPRLPVATAGATK